MEKIRMTLLMLLIAVASYGQSAQQVLDKTAKIISNKDGVTAHFALSSQQYGNTSGSISIKGRKFFAETKDAKVWFDGKTQWTYVKQNEEVNVNNPSASDLQAINPYNFIYMYKQGYTATMTKSGQNFVVTLKGTGKSIQEMVVTIHQKTYIPSQIRMLQNKQWTTINVSGFKQVKLADDEFKFNRKKYPHAEIIDLR